nr:hypothetical protein [Streptomyces klenkii]
MHDALIKKLTGRVKGAADRESGKSLSDRLAWLEKKHKDDEKAAAQDAGVSLRTWRRWKEGKATPSRRSLKKLDQATRAALIPAGRRRRISLSTRAGRIFDRRPKGGFTITAWITVSSDDRPRTLALGSHLSEGRLDKVVQAYINEGEEGAVRELEDAIREYMGGYQGHLEISNVSNIDFGPIG